MVIYVKVEPCYHWRFKRLSSFQLNQREGQQPLGIDGVNSQEA